MCVTPNSFTHSLFLLSHSLAHSLTSFAHSILFTHSFHSLLSSLVTVAASRRRRCYGFGIIRLKEATKLPDSEKYANLVYYTILLLLELLYYDHYWCACAPADAKATPRTRAHTHTHTHTRCGPKRAAAIRLCSLRTDPWPSSRRARERKSVCVCTTFTSVCISMSVCACARACACVSV